MSIPHIQLPLFQSTSPGHWEKEYVRKYCEALAIAFTKPAMLTGPSSAGMNPDERVKNERLQLLITLNKRHQKQLARIAPHALEDAFSELAVEWIETVSRLTNFEVCLTMMESSLRGPLSPEWFEEYKRAFAHCFEDRYSEVFGDEPINVNSCKMVRMYHTSKHKLPPLDDAEIQWIEAFNKKIKA